MNKIALILIIFISGMLNGTGQDIHLIPYPAEVKLLPGRFTLKGSVTIGYNKPEAGPLAEDLARRLSLPTGLNITAKSGSVGAVRLILNDIPDQRIGNEGYALEAGTGLVLLKANQPAGLFYGIQTLLKLFPGEIESKTVTTTNWSVPGLTITDYPRFGWRGLMLDVSRHFFSKEDVKKYIDQMVKYKFNTLHLHLTDDNGWRIEIKSLPRLTEVGAWRVARAGHFGERADPKPGEPGTYGGFYTQDDIREMVKYASDRFVTLVPEIDLPGHSMALLSAYPELSCRKDQNTNVNPGTNFAEWYGNGTFKMNIENTVNPADEKVYAYLEKIFTEVASLFPGPYIHVGGDECYKGYWAQDEGCKALMKKLDIRHVEDLQGYFMGRLEQILKTKGKKLLGWDEILEGGISPEATVMSWRGQKGGIEAAQMGHNVVMTPNSFAYIDFQQGEPTIEPPVYASLRLKKCYGFDPVPPGVDPKFILGGQGNLWTEQIPTLRHAEYMTWPRAWALSEVFWSPESGKNWDSFISRVEDHFGRSDMAGINYSKAIYDPVINFIKKGGKLWMEMETEAPGLDLFYTMDDTMPDGNAGKYSKLVEVPDGPVTLRVISWRNGKPIGHLITLNPAEIKKRTVTH